MLDNQARNAKILVMGVGGGGCNAVNSMIASGVESAEFVAVNTDAQAINMSKAESKITIGASITRGLGAGSRPDVGKQAADESRNELDKQLENVDMLFITAGMGGGTGTGAAPVIASIARDKGILTVGVVTKPFAFEGEVRARNAEEGIANLKKYCDTLIVIPNDNLLKVLGPKATMLEAFKHADSVLRDAVKGLSDLIAIPSMINVDFADVKTIMKDKGMAHLAVGSAEGPDKIKNAVNKAVMSMLLNTNISGATGILLNVIGGPSLGMMEAIQASELVRQCVAQDALIIFGFGIEEDYGDKVQVLLVATGFEENAKQSVTRYGYKNADHAVIDNDTFIQRYGIRPEGSAMQQPQQQMVADASQYVAQPQQQMQQPQMQQPVQQPQMQARPQYSYNSIFGNQPQPQQAQPEPQSTGKKLPPWFSRFSNRSV
ncbi:MAG: cell division protein FtsZ [Clostridia bacterium]|nr:cell division protein FtsZ [Clostridia bacterium]